MQYNHYPVTPGAIIGKRKDGTLIRLIAGGSEPAPQPPANGGAEPVQPPAPAPAPPADPATGQPAANAAPGTGDGAPPSGTSQQPASVDDLPAWAQRTIKELRSENAASRTKAKEHADALAAFRSTHDQQMDGIAKALGLKPEEVTPEQLAAERDAARADSATAAARAQAAQVELAAYRAAATLGADPLKLLDSRAFVTTLDGLDPSSAEFAQAIRDRVASALETNPGLRLAPAAPPAPDPGAPSPVPGTVPPPLQQQPPQPAVPASGPQGTFGTPPAGPRQLTVEDAARMSPQAVQEAINAGQFEAAGFGRSRKLTR